MLDQPGQFQVAPIPAALGAIAARYAVVDVQLAGDALARDEAFVREHGDLIAPGHYRHRTLTDKLGAEGMARVRRFVADLLGALTTEGDRFVFCLSGGLRADLDDEHRDDRLLLSGGVDEAGLGGAFVLFGGEREDLDFEVQRLGDHDRLRGLAGPGLTLAQVLPQLTLASPVPTTSERLQAGREPFAALQAVLPRARLFFEELGNGTRLRLVSGRLARGEIEAAVVAVRGSLGAPRRGA